MKNLKLLAMVLTMFAGFSVLAPEAQACTWTGQGTTYFYNNAGAIPCGSWSPNQYAGSGTYNYFYTYPGSRIRITTCGSSFDTQLTIFDYAGAWTQRAYNDDNGPDCGGLTASVDYQGTCSGVSNINHIAIVNRYNCQQHDFTGVSAILKMQELAPYTPAAPSIQVINCGNTVLQTNSTPDCGVTYYWHTSATGTSTTYTGTTHTITSSGTWYLRARSSHGCWSASSAGVYAPVYNVQGSAGTYGNGYWYVSCYNGSNFNTYYGYYTQNGYSFDSRNRWCSTCSPSDANGSGGSAYSGCIIPVDYHSTRSRRTGFTCGYYRIDVPNHDDAAYVYVNGTQVWGHSGCCDAHTGVWYGDLDASSTVEITQQEGSGGSHIGINVVNITGTLTGGSITGGTVTVCSGYNSGTLQNTASPTGGSHGYSYQWELNTGSGYLPISGATGATYDPPAYTTTGTYYLRRKVTDGCNNIAYSNVRTVNVVADPTTTVTSVNMTVCSGGSYTLTWTGSGGTGSTSYQVQSSPNNSTWTTIATGLGSGSYTFNNITSNTYYRGRYVKNGSYCNDPYTASRLVTVVSDPSVAIYTSSQTICSGGSVSLACSVAGGTGNCTIQWQRSPAGAGSWSNVGTNSVGYNTGALTSSYDYRVYYSCNGSGCDGYYSNSVTMTVVPDPSISITTAPQTICPGGSVTLSTSTSGGTGSLGYQWQSSPNNSTWSNIGGATGSSYNAVPTSSTYYRVQRTAGGTGCSSPYSSSKLITVVADPSVSINQSSQSICYNTGLSLTASASGGTGTQSYQWQSSPNNSTWSNVGSNSSSYSTGNLTSTTYYRVRRSATGNGCNTATSAVVTITVPSQLTVGTSTSSSTCGNANGSATANPSGGTSPYSYAWQGGGSNATKGSLSAGSYTVTVTDGLGCTATGTANVTDIGSPSASITGQTNLVCYGASNGNATVTVSGGTAPFNISWSNGSNNNGVGPGSYQVTGLSAGGITATVSDANGCVVSANTNITQPTQLVATIGSVTDVLCYGNATGAIDLNVSGGTGAKSYSWSNGGGSSQDVTNATAGTYNVTVTDANGCTATASATISQPAAALSATSTTVDVDCNGNGNGSINMTVNGGTTPYTYLWSSGATTQDLSSLSGGTYTVTITDAHSCTLTHSKTIAEPTALVFGSTTTTDVDCKGNSTGVIAVSGSGGTTPYTYSINGGSYVASGNFTGLSAATYTIRVKDNHNCIATQSVTITEPAAVLSATLNFATNVQCNGDNTGEIDVTVTGGTTPYTYSWTGPGGPFSTQDISNLLAGTYNLTVTDAHSCSTTFSHTITQNPVLSATASVTNVTGCFNNNNGAVTFTPSGGSNTTYLYSLDNGSTYQSSPTFSSLTAGTYYPRLKDAGLTDTTINCSVALSNVVITQPADYGAPILPGGSSYSSCGLLVVNATPQGSGATTCLLYTSVPVPGGSVDTANAFVFNALIAGTYTYYVTSYNPTLNCESSTYTTFTVDVVNPVLVTGTVTDVTCYGSANGAIDITPSGGTPPYTYQWSNGATSQDLTGLSGSSYNVIVTDANGCFNIGKFQVVEHPPLTASVTIPVLNGYTIKCAGDSSGQAVVNVTGGDGNYTYAWSDGGTTGSRNDFPAGSYTLTVTDGNGCSVTKSANYSDPPAMSLNYVTSYQCSGGGYSSATVSLIPSGGQSPFTYRINNTNYQTAANFSGIYNGSTDKFFVRDANGCEDSIVVNTTLPVGNSPVGDCGFVYVAPGSQGGDINNPGTPDCPTTLGAAMTYITASRNHIRLLGGASQYTYSSPVEFVNDIIVEGGYERDVNGNWRKNTSLSTVINFDNAYVSPVSGVGYYVGLISDNKSGWLLKDVTLNVQVSGAAGTQDGNGRSVYGLLITDGSNNYELNNVQINVGDASNGSDGNAGTDGANGTNGSDGDNGRLIGDDTAPFNTTSYKHGNFGGEGGAGAGANGGSTQTPALFGVYSSDKCAPRGSSDRVSGGAGGTGSNGGNFDGTTPQPVVNSGAGGNGGFISGPCNYDAIGGNPTSSSSAGFVWDFYNTPQPSPTDPGVNGNNGEDGSNGSGYTAGNQPGTASFGEVYFPAQGSDGDDGYGGAGGSGGSAAASVMVDGRYGSPTFVNFVMASGAGGGGGGGEAGYGGEGGYGGGSAFGVYVSSTSTTGASLQHVFVNSLGAAGNGGAGGVGGTGGVGGFGGSGGPAITDTTISVILTGVAGNGGNGGTGGTGGRGQDGDDGVATAIYYGGGSAPAQTPAPSNGTVGVLNVKGCTNSEVIITKTSSDNWNLLSGGAYENDITSSTSSFNGSSDTAFVYYTSTGAKDLGVGATTYSSFIIISSSRSLPVITSAPYSSVCVGGTIDLTTNATGIDYRWAVSNVNSPQTGLFGSSSQNVYGLTVPVSGTFQVKLQVRDECCGWSIPVYATFTIDPVPDAVASISGASSVCAGQSGVTYTAPVSALASSNTNTSTGYLWTVPSGATITSAGGAEGVVSGGNVSITVDFGSNSGDVTVTPSNGCGDGPSTSKTITIAPSPVVTAISGASTICNGSSEILSAVVSGGSGSETYLWSANAGSATTSSVSISPSTTTTYSVTVTEGACSHSLSKTITVDPVPAAGNPITGDQNVFYGESGVVYSTTAVSGALTYQWTVPSGATITAGQGTLSITVDWGTATSGNVICTPMYNLCGGSASVLAVTVNTPPLVWNGNVSTDWNTATNWTPNTVPTISDNALIPNGRPRYPSTYTGTPVAHSLQIESAASVTLEAGITMTIDGDIAVASGGSLNMPAQAGSAGTIHLHGDWNVDGSFTAAPVTSGGAVVFDGTSAQAINGATQTFFHMEIDNSAGVTTTVDEYVSGQLRLTAGNLASDGHITLKSDASRTGLIDDFTAGRNGTISGDITMQLYVPAGSRGFHHIGSPVNTPNVSQLGELNLYGPNGGQVLPLFYCDPDAIDPLSPYGNLFEWREDASFTFSCTQAGWFVRSSGTMTNGRGYAAIFGDTTNSTLLDISGAATTGAVAYNGLTRTSTTGDGQHLVTNPYPSPIEWTAPSGFLSAAQVWHSSGSYLGTYQPVLSGIGEVLPAMQGFFIEVNGAGPANYTLSNSNRTVTGGTFNRQAQWFDYRLTVDLVSSTGNNDVTYVAFASNPDFVITDSFDGTGLDAQKNTVLGGNNLYTHIYSYANPIAINTMPTAFSTVKHVPMALEVGQDGTFTFNMNVEDFDPTMLIFLEDLKTGTLQNVRDNNIYTFTQTLNDDADRFILHFVPAAVIAATDADCDGLNGAVSIDLGAYTVNSNPIEWDSYSLVDASSNVVASGTNVSGLINVAQLAEGAYTLTLNYGNYQAVETIDVNGLDPVQAAYVPGFNVAYTNSLIQFYNQSVGATTYSWDFGDGTTSTLEDPTHIYQQPGSYDVVLVASNGDCSDTYTQNYKVEGTTGIADPDAPVINILGFKNRVTVVFNNITEPYMVMNIYDVTGRKVIETKRLDTKQSKHIVELNNIASGYYFVTIEGENGSTDKKVFLTNK